MTRDRCPVHAHEDDELSDLAWSLGRLWHSIVHDLEHGPQCCGLQHQHLRILRLLHEGPKRMSDLAALTSTTSANVTGLVDRLVERGLVERVRSEQDRRVVDVALTEHGREQGRMAKAAFRAKLGELTERLTAEERAEFARLLKKAAEPARAPEEQG